MLVLTRKQDEQIRIGEDITITIVRTKGKAVRLGIQAPEHIRILRGEHLFDLVPADKPSAPTVEATHDETAPASQGPLAAFAKDASRRRREAGQSSARFDAGSAMLAPHVPGRTSVPNRSRASEGSLRSDLVKR